MWRLLRNRDGEGQYLTLFVRAKGLQILSSAFAFLVLPWPEEPGAGPPASITGVFAPGGAGEWTSGDREKELFVL